MVDRYNAIGERNPRSGSIYVMASDYDSLAAENNRQHEKIDKMLGYHVEDKARVTALEAERDAYILKQKVWEDANDELRSQHVKYLEQIRLCSIDQFNAEARVAKLETAIVNFWNWSKFVLPMPVHPAVGAIMELGREIASALENGSRT